ncbi:MAG: triose-phosphate isomerase [Gammaproteobacteria bacterium]|nr:triose-phosphate isomerase [Gammaproteobacteria bacterium]
MRRPLVMGNWKMNGRLESAKVLLAEVAAGARELASVEIAVCPPFPFLNLGRTHSDISLGAQNVAAEAEGAYTGEVSAAMLKDVGCRYVIVGHSERRTLFGESNAVVARKFAQAQAQGLIPVLCVGETADERNRSLTEEVIGGQIHAVVAAAGAAAFAGAVVAYEPMWAIGSGRAAAPEDAQAVHHFIRSLVARLSAEVAAGLRILYGGSVKAQNAPELFAQADIDGGLIGGAALNAREFAGICQAADKAAKKGS